MAFGKVPVELTKDTRVPDAAIRLYALMWGEWGDGKGGNVYPGKETIAKMIGWSVRTVDRMVVALQEAGWVSVQLGGGRNHTNRYHLNPVSIYPVYSDGEKRNRVKSVHKPRQIVQKNPVRIDGGTRPIEPDPRTRPSKKEEDLPFDDPAGEEIPEWLQTLREIDHYPRSWEADQALIKFSAGRAPALLNRTAADMAAKLGWDGKKGKWTYPGGPRGYTNIRATFKSWVLGSESKEVKNGRTNGHGPNTLGQEPYAQWIIDADRRSREAEERRSALANHPQNDLGASSQ